ncbi:MAG: hypothetical protein ACLSAH_19165 [Bilophila wadsworthia]
MKLLRKEKKPQGITVAPSARGAIGTRAWPNAAEDGGVPLVQHAASAEAWRLVGGAASLGWFLPIRSSVPSRRTLAV